MTDYPCGGIRREQQLMLYVGGELPSWERLLIEMHLRNCPVCREHQALILSTMQSVAAEVRGGSLPHWEAQGMMVSASALSGRFHSTPIGSARLVTLATISAAVAVLTSYMAATYGDRLTRSPSVPLSHVNTVATPCASPESSLDSSCRNCAATPSAPKVTPE